MVLFLHSDTNYEEIAISCIKSLSNKITEDVKIVYYTIGFDSSFEFKNLTTHRIEPDPLYIKFDFYKPELALLTMDLFPDEHYLYVDADILFSRRFNFESVKHNYNYPLASFGPHEEVFLWTCYDDVFIRYDERKLMQYFNVPERSQRYVWACFFSFNPSCREFMEEYSSICRNKYLLDRSQDYLPFRDETAFNICLWKRGATENYGFGFVNTHAASTVISVEEGASNMYFDNAVDWISGGKWEYVDDNSNVMFYHGIRDLTALGEALDYLLLPNETQSFSENKNIN